MTIPPRHDRADQRQGARPWVRWVAAALLVLALAPSALIADTYHDKPDATATGGIVGVIRPAEGLQAVIAVDPIEFRAYMATPEPGGRFALRGLPPAEYDLLIKASGRVYEGLSLDANHDSAEAEGSPSSSPQGDGTESTSTSPGASSAATPAGRTGPADLKAVTQEVGKTFFGSEDYFNRKQIVRLAASGDRAHLFVIQTRTKPVVDPGGDPIRATIRRFDYVEMIKTHKVWQLARSRHLLRQEVPYGSPDAEVKAVHSPQLGGILVGAKVKELDAIDLGKLTPSPAGRFGSATWEAK